jgi:uncharacterized protein (TIGR04255 family)
LTLPTLGYTPFARKNAIAEMTIGIQFAASFDSSIAEHEEAVKDAFREDFPKYEPLQQVTVSFGAPPFPGPGPNAGSIAGFVLTRTKSALMEHNRVVSIVLRYLGRFTFDGPPQDATARALFQENTNVEISR